MPADRRLLVATVAGVALLLAADAHRAFPLLLWNVTTSAPLGAYLVIPFLEPTVGDYVAVRPQRAVGRWMDGRGYLPLGVPLLKRLAARAGQEVCRYGSRVTVDGRLVGRARYSDRWGRALPEWAGCRRLRAGEFFLMNAHPDSLDGRYLGVTRASDVIGRAWPLRTY